MNRRNMTRGLTIFFQNINKSLANSHITKLEIRYSTICTTRNNFVLNKILKQVCGNIVCIIKQIS